MVGIPKLRLRASSWPRSLWAFLNSDGKRDTQERTTKSHTPPAGTIHSVPNSELVSTCLLHLYFKTLGARGRPFRRRTWRRCCRRGCSCARLGRVVPPMALAATLSLTRRRRFCRRGLAWARRAGATCNMIGVHRDRLGRAGRGRCSGRLAITRWWWERWEGLSLTRRGTHAAHATSPAVASPPGRSPKPTNPTELARPHT